MFLERAKLSTSFYDKNTKTVAKELLGKKLVRILNKKRLSGIIVETEAYLGKTDDACHSRNGIKTKRNASMYLPGGHVYVYFIYGMYYCVNVVTKGPSYPEAVLIRAIEPIEGICHMKIARKNPKKDIYLTNGPGKLAKALSIDKTLDGASLEGSHIFIENSPLKLKPIEIITATRIGISKNNKACNLPLRYYIKNNPYVSKY